MKKKNTTAQKKANPSPDSTFVWTDSHGTGRNLFSLFRRTFTLKKLPESATLHLFADTRYRLRVNGTILTYGPGRFIPSHPQFDSVEIAPHLIQGKNTITVEVNHYGASSFQTTPGSIAGFNAWGSIPINKTSSIDLATPGDWKAKKINAWDAQSPPFSFAQGPVEILNLAKLPEKLFLPTFNDSSWKTPTPLINQETWGSLSSRNIPDLLHDEISPQKILSHSTVQNDEERLSLRTFLPDAWNRRQKGENFQLAYATVLHSPKKQTITLGTFWGTHYLNGSQLELTNDPSIGNRRNASITLKKGPNLLYGEIDISNEAWGLLTGIPRSAGITASASLDLKDPNTLLFSDPLPKEEIPSHREKIPATFKELSKTTFTWNGTSRIPTPTTPALPARQVAWNRPEKILSENNYHITDTHLDLTSHHAHTIIYDFDSEYLGHPVIDITAPAGTTIDLAYGEMLRPDGGVFLYQNPFVDSVDRFITRSGRQRIENFHTRGGRYLQLTITRPPSEKKKTSATIHKTTLRRSNTSLKQLGHFSCSDPLLNWIYTAGLETFYACTEDTYMDCPWRERGLYLGDAYIEATVNRAINPDLSIARRSLELWAQSQKEDGQLTCCAPTWLALILEDFSLIWILFLRDYCNWTADKAFAKQMWPIVEKILNSPTWESHSSGLWNAENLQLVLIDQGSTKDSRKGYANAGLNAFRYAALLSATDLATFIGKRAKATTLQQEAEAVKKAFQKTLWDKENHRFTAALDEKDQPIDTPSAHANILAILFDLPTNQQLSGTRRYILDHLSSNHLLATTSTEKNIGIIELAFFHYTLPALYKLGETSFAEQLLRNHYSIMKERGAWTLWECLQWGYHDIGSLCHAWGASPITAFFTQILGIQITPKKPNEITIAPNTSTVTHAEGTYPHPAGNITVAWNISGNNLNLSITAPKAIKLTIAPAPSLEHLELITEIDQT